MIDVKIKATAEDADEMLKLARYLGEHGIQASVTVLGGKPDSLPANVPEAPFEETACAAEEAPGSSGAYGSKRLAADAGGNSPAESL